MSKAFLVAHREFLDNIRTRSFWIGVLMFPLLLVLFVVVPRVLERTKTARRYAVVDQSGWLGDAVQARIVAGDVAIALQRAAAAHRVGGASLEELPDILRRIAPRAAELEAERVAAVAYWLAVEPAAPGGVDPTLWTHRDALLAWREALTTREARRVSPQLSRARYVRVATPADVNEADLDSMIADGELFAYFVIGPDPVEGSAGSRYVSRNLTDTELRDWFAAVATAEAQSRRLARAAIEPRVAHWIQEPLQFAGVEAEDRLRQWVPVGFVYLLWVSVFTVSQMLLTNTVEEKSNRIMEVLLSSVSPVQLMAGKIGGIAATGLTLVGSWVIAFVAGIKLLPALLGSPLPFDLAALLRDPLYFGSFVLYFLLGYLLYASLLVAIGSVCNTLKEAQNLMGPVTLLLIVPLMAMVPIAKDPNGTLAQALSYVPPYTPFVMMNRAAGPPAAVEYAATTALLILSIAGALWAAAKVFRVGILLTGKAPRLGEIIRWIRAPVTARSP